MALSEQDVREILRIIDESELEELLVETNNFSLHVRKGAAAVTTQQPDMQTIPSPMLGTFYRAESPGAEPFVQVGTEVSEEATVCIIEVMKMMNSVPAGVSGVISEVLVENGQLVEYGEPLFAVTPR